MSSDSLGTIITNMLTQEGFVVLECADVSAAHQGHAGYDAKGSHFNVVLQGTFTTAQERLKTHQRVLSLFAAMIPRPIHALSLRFQQ